MEHFQFLAENTDQVFTGLAVAETLGATATLNLKARSETGQTVATTQIVLNRYNHQAFFIDQKLPIPQGFRGTVEVVASEPIAALAIRMEGNQFSTMAVLPYVAAYDFTISLVDGRTFKGVLTFSDDTGVLKGFIHFTDPSPDASSDMDLPFLGAGDSSSFQASTMVGFSNLGIGTVYVYLSGANGMGDTTGVCTCNDTISAAVAWSQSSALLTRGHFSATRRQ